MAYEPKIAWKRRKNGLRDFGWNRTLRRDSLSECLFALVELAIGSYCAYLLLDTLNRWYSGSRETSEFVLRPAWIVLFIPPAMTCLGLLLLFHDSIKTGLFNHVLRRDIPESWQNTPLSGALRKIAIVWSVALLIVSVALVPLHTRFTRDRVTTQAMWPMPERHRAYTAIESIAMAYYFSPPGAHSSGGWSTQRALYLWFCDGDSWTTMNGLAEANLYQREKLADFVSERSGVPVKYPPRGDTR